MPYELEGTVKAVMPQQTFGSGFTKREFIVTTASDRYPQDIKLECLKDKTALLDEVRAGDKVKVTFDLRGGEHNARYFVNLVAWKIESSDGSSSSGGSSGGGGGEYRPSAPKQDRPRPSGGGGGGGGARPPRDDDYRGGGGGGGGKRDREWGDRGDRSERGGGGRAPRDEDFRGGGRRGGYQEDDIDF